VFAVTFSLEAPAHFLDGRPQRAGFALLAAFLLSFAFIRTSARLMRSPKVPWWPGSVVTEGGLHLHHLVWGILLVLLAGFLSFVTRPGSPGTEVLAGLFGVGAGFTLDEFALWVHLRDVYWAEEGRSSFDAVVVATVIGGLIVLGAAPFDLRNNTAPVETLLIAIVLDVLLAAIAIYKGKRLLGVIGIFVPLASLVGSVRLAAPRSRWAQRLYAPDGRKLARAQARWARIEARRRRVADAIAGAPEASVAIEPGPTANEPVAHQPGGED
jgi:hypothetical protein